MRSSSLIPAILAVFGVSLVSAPAAKATVLGNPLASVTVKGSAELADYYDRSDDYCDRGYKKRYRHKTYSYRTTRTHRRHYDDDDDYGHRHRGHKKSYYSRKSYDSDDYGDW